MPLGGQPLDRNRCAFQRVVPCTKGALRSMRFNGIMRTATPVFERLGLNLASCRAPELKLSGVRTLCDGLGARSRAGCFLPPSLEPASPAADWVERALPTLAGFPMMFVNRRSASGEVDLIRFRGHLPKGGYDVQTDGRHPQAPAAPAIR